MLLAAVVVFGLHLEGGVVDAVGVAADNVRARSEDRVVVGLE